MANQIETQAIDFIVKHRAIKLVFVAISVVGIAKGAFDVVAPLATTLLKPVVKALEIRPSNTKAAKFDCLISVPKMIGEVNAYLFAIDPAIDETEAKDKADFFSKNLVFNSQRQMLHCYALSSVPTSVIGEGAVFDSKSPSCWRPVGVSS